MLVVVIYLTNVTHPVLKILKKASYVDLLTCIEYKFFRINLYFCVQYTFQNLNKQAYDLAKALLKRTAQAIEPYITNVSDNLK